MSSDHSADVQRYIDGVLDGSIVTGRLQRLAVHRHCDDLKFAGERGFYFDEKLAWNAIEFSLCCRQFKGEWSGIPLMLRPEQKFIAWCLFGWRKKANGYRRFRHAQLEVARKWGKSTMVAYMACLLLFADCPFEPAAEGVCVATQKEQARTVWDMVAQMIEQSPDLKAESRILRGRHEILVPGANSWFKPLAIDENAGDSFSLHILIKDEEHAYRKQHKKMMGALGSGFGARRQPLTMTITTYGDDKSEIWKGNHDYAVRIVESVISGEIIDDSWFVFIAAVDYPLSMPCFRCHGDSCKLCGGSGVIQPDDPFDEKCWVKANPGLPITPKIDEMREFANEAKYHPDTRREMFQKRLNIIVASSQRVIPAETWKACAGELSDWSLADDIHGGFDLGATDDLASVAMLAAFKCEDDAGEPFTRYEIKSKSFISEERPEHMRKEFLARWVSEGRLHQSDGPAVDYNEVEEFIVAWAKEYPVATWAHDKNEARQMGQSLINEHGLPTFQFSQFPCHYSEPVKRFLSLLQQSRIVNGKVVSLITHDGDPVLAWQATNLIIRTNAKGEGMPDKSDPENKIDAMVSVLMAFSECLYADAHRQPSGAYYHENDLEFA